MMKDDTLLWEKEIKFSKIEATERQAQVHNNILLPPSSQMGFNKKQGSALEKRKRISSQNRSCTIELPPPQIIGGMAGVDAKNTNLSSFLSPFNQQSSKRQSSAGRSKRAGSNEGTRKNSS
jgi:hypothetical protein